MIDNVIFRMPDEMEYFLPACSVAQNYISQQYIHWHRKTKAAEPRFTIEVGDDSHLYLNSMFPRMQFFVREQETLARSEWDCVIDFRDINRVTKVAEATQKHITEAWSAMFGASAPQLPVLGPIAVTCQSPKYHFLIDEELECAEELRSRFPFEAGALIQIASVNNRRTFWQFERLADCCCYIGKRSGASYLAATMLKGYIEIWPRTIPYWFLYKPKSDGARIIIGDNPSVEMLLEQMKELFPLMVDRWNRGNTEARTAA